nr:hypothetical protein [Nitrosomonas nitrosa]
MGTERLSAMAMRILHPSACRPLARTLAGGESSPRRLKPGGWYCSPPFAARLHLATPGNDSEHRSGASTPGGASRSEELGGGGLRPESGRAAASRRRAERCR